MAYISLPNDTHYTLAVFVKDFKGNEKHAAKAIERISAAVYAALTTNNYSGICPASKSTHKRNSVPDKNISDTE